MGSSCVGKIYRETERLIHSFHSRNNGHEDVIHLINVTVRILMDQSALPSYFSEHSTSLSSPLVEVSALVVLNWIIIVSFSMYYVLG